MTEQYCVEGLRAALILSPPFRDPGPRGQKCKGPDAGKSLGFQSRRGFSERDCGELRWEGWAGDYLQGPRFWAGSWDFSLRALSMW